jgi:hypothetical protein
MKHYFFLLLLQLALFPLLLSGQTVPDTTDLYISKQNGQYKLLSGSAGPKTTDKYEHGLVNLQVNGPLLYTVAPELSIDTGQTKTWQGSVWPNVANGPAAGSTATASITGNWTVTYSRPQGMAVDSQATGTTTSVVPWVDYGPLGDTIAMHEMVTRQGIEKLNFKVISIKLDVPDTVYYDDDVAYIHASAYPSTTGTIAWQTPAGTFTGSHVAIPVDPNTTRIQQFTSTLSVDNVTYSDTGRLVPVRCTHWIECPPGNIFVAPLGTVCLECAPGKFVAAPPGYVCIECPEGSGNFIAGLPGSVCKECPTGSNKYIITSPGTTCVECPPGSGKIATGPAGITCIECPAQSNKYTTAAAGDSCMECPAGKFKTGPIGGLCTECPPASGRFSIVKQGELCCPGTGTIFDPTVKQCLSCNSFTRVVPLGWICCWDVGVVFYYDPVVDKCDRCPMGGMSRLSPRSWLCCDGVDFNPEVNDCIHCGTRGRVVPKGWTGCCGNTVYDQTVNRCVSCGTSSGQIVPKDWTGCCGSTAYDETVNRCISCGTNSNQVVPKGWTGCCGSTAYDQTVNQCISCSLGSNQVVPIGWLCCDGTPYDPATHKCCPAVGTNRRVVINKDQHCQ